MYQDRLAEAEAVIQKAADRKIDVVQLSLCRYYVSFLKGERAAMEREMIYRNTKFHAQGPSRTRRLRPWRARDAGKKRRSGGIRR